MSKSNVELRRWCIEMAMNWPMNHGNYGLTYSQNPQDLAQASLYAPPIEQDIMGRAKKLFDWVTEK